MENSDDSAVKAAVQQERSRVLEWLQHFRETGDSDWRSAIWAVRSGEQFLAQED